MSEIKPEIMEQFLKQIESEGVGKFASYDLEKEVELINEKKSSLSSSQRQKTLYLYKQLKKD